MAKMEQFEKWFEETYPLPPTIERGPIGRDLKSGCRGAWKAALEWALTNKKPIKYHAYKFDYIKTDVVEEEVRNARDKIQGLE